MDQRSARKPKRTWVGSAIVTLALATSLGAQAQLELTDPGPEHHFGPVPLGETYATQYFSFFNRGANAVRLGQAVIDAEVVTCAALGCSVASAADFEIVAHSDGCSGKTLAAGEGCSSLIAFVPKAPGARTARLRMPLATAGGSAPVERLLNGTGCSEPVDCQLDWAEHRFPKTFSSPTATIVVAPFHARCYQGGTLCAGADVLATAAPPSAYLYREGRLERLESLTQLAALTGCKDGR